MRDLREWVARLERDGRARARGGPGRSPPRDHGDRRPHVEGRTARRCCSTERRPAAELPVLINQFGTSGACAPPSTPSASTPWAADRVADGPAAAAGGGGQGERAGRCASWPRSRPRRARGALPGGLARRAGPRPAAHPHLLARRRRPLHHAAAGLHPRPRHRRAQLRHVPPPELDRRTARCTGNHKTAPPTCATRWGGCRWRWPSAPIRPRPSPPSARCRPAWTRCSSPASCAAAAWRWCAAGRSTLRCRPSGGRARGLRGRGRPAPRGALRRPHRLLHAGGRLPGLPPHRHVDAPRRDLRATIVGPPPMEDFWLGKATERLFLPLIR